MSVLGAGENTESHALDTPFTYSADGSHSFPRARPSERCAKCGTPQCVSIRVLETAYVAKMHRLLKIGDLLRRHCPPLAPGREVPQRGHSLHAADALLRLSRPAVLRRTGGSGESQRNQSSVPNDEREAHWT